MLKCKICSGTVVWCGSDDHAKHSGDEPHACHQLVCLTCDSIYDLGYAKGIKSLGNEDADDYLESLEKLRGGIVNLYLNGLE